MRITFISFLVGYLAMGCFVEWLVNHIVSHVHDQHQVDYNGPNMRESLMGVFGWPGIVFSAFYLGIDCVARNSAVKKWWMK